MTGPIPYGLHVISGELTDQDTDRILAVIHRFLTYKEAAQLENLKQVYDLPDGGYFIVQHVGGLFRVIADKQEPEKFKFVNDGLVKNYIPMFFSGVITQSSVFPGEKVGLKLTEQCRVRLEKSTGKKPSKELRLQRFTIEADQGFTEFLSNPKSSRINTQYVFQNPGWYSGSMAKAMQFVGGYGRQDFDNLPDDPFERAQLKLPDSLLKPLWEKYREVRLPGYSGVPEMDGAFRYDYKGIKTHAISFDSDNKPWLIEVSDKVWAMPLPIVPITASELFHKYVEEELNDNELLQVLQTFGAMPSGESFPKDRQDFQRWVRAGVIIEVCDVSDFRQHIPMYTACGWSFNDSGSMAYNTAYKYDETTGLIYCSTYKLNLNLSPSPHYFGTNPVLINDGKLSDVEQVRLNNYLSGLNRVLSKGEPRSNAILYKLRHVGNDKILERASSNVRNFIDEIYYWDDYIAEPMVKHSGHVNKVYGGYLYHPNKYLAQPQIKFPDVFNKFCASFDFTPITPGWTVACDTIMFAYFENNSLKVVKYFYDGYTYQKSVDTDFEKYMTVGKWYRNTTEGVTSLVGHFYTSDIDERNEVSPVITETTIEGRDAGYDSKPFFSFDEFFWRPGTLWRNRYYTHLSKTTTTHGSSMDIGVCIPMLQRAGVLHAYKESYGSKSYSESYKLLSIQDPYSYRYWTNDWIWAWNGGLSVQKGSPYPQNGNPVWVEIENYNPTEYSDFADNGPWIPALPADYTWLIHPDRAKWQHSGGGGKPKINEYSKTSSIPPKNDTGNLKWAFLDMTLQVKTTIPDGHYFSPSPDEFGFTMYRDGSRVFLGQTEYGNISEYDLRGIRKSVGYSNLVDSKSAYHFIGVVDE